MLDTHFFALTFLPLLILAAARFACDSWPTCYHTTFATRLNNSAHGTTVMSPRCNVVYYPSPEMRAAETLLG